ncbi:unnamed protein product [Larinioides sclopetarius]|uniref:Uncharacterized protein n=1 Tax=Larinioides sclopetarius TaxID=280406 RepID=A0AAV2B8D2_9ARAC
MDQRGCERNETPHNRFSCACVCVPMCGPLLQPGGGVTARQMTLSYFNPCLLVPLSDVGPKSTPVKSIC